MKFITNSSTNVLSLLQDEVMQVSVGQLDFYSNSSNVKVLIFIPSISFANQYASMMLLAFRHYFMEGKTFLDEKPSIDFIFIINNESTTDIYNLRIIEDFIKNKVCFIHYDKEEKFFNLFGIKASKDLNDSAVVFLLNEENKILWKTDSYRANGERIKLLDNALKAYLNFLNIAKIDDIDCPILKVGDKAPNFLLKGILSEDNKSTFLDEIADIKILSFYPAVFSGILNTPKILANNQSCVNSLHCRRQISLLDNVELKNKNLILKKYLITNTTSELLKLWKEISDTQLLCYLNDEDCLIAKKYNAFHEEGYNTRLTYVVDAQGFIRAIVDLKTDEDIQLLNDILQSLV